MSLHGWTICAPLLHCVVHVRIVVGSVTLKGMAVAVARVKLLEQEEVGRGSRQRENGVPSVDVCESPEY